MARLTIIVQVIRTEAGVMIGGVIDPNGPPEVAAYMVLDKTRNHKSVLDRLAFRRAERRKDQWFSSTHLLDASHLKLDGSYGYSLLLEIPIKDGLPFVDILPCGIVGKSDRREYRVYLMHTDTCVQDKKTLKEFAGAYPLEMLRSQDPEIYHSVIRGIRKYQLDQNDPAI